MCFCDCGLILSVILLAFVLVLQAIAVCGFSVIAFGISLIGVLLVHFKTDLTTNTTIWGVGALMILSYLSHGFNLGYKKSDIKTWFNKQKKKSPIMLGKLPLLIYFLLFCGAIAELFYQHPIQKTLETTSPELNHNANDQGQLIVVSKFSLIFLCSMSYIVYTSAGSSDWLTYLSKPTTVRQQNFSLGCMIDLTACILSEVLETFLNVLLLWICLLPLIFEHFQYCPRIIMITAMIGVICAAFLKIDKVCPQLRKAKNFYSAENRLLAKNFLVYHLWIPMVVIWFMKNWKPVLFNYHLSDRKDFAIWVSLLSLALFKILRNMTVHIPCWKSSNRIANMNVVAEEPVGGGDNTRRKIPLAPGGPATVVDRLADVASCPRHNGSNSTGGTTTTSTILDNNNNDKDTRIIAPMVHKIAVFKPVVESSTSSESESETDDEIPEPIQPSAPTFEEINEVKARCEATPYNMAGSFNNTNTDYINYMKSLGGYSNMV